MKSTTRFGKSFFSICSATALMLMAGMAQMASALEPYEGTATLCAVDMTGVTQVVKGKKGITYIYNQKLLFRIDSDNILMHGWEVLTSNTKAKPDGGGYSWGEALLTPDGYEGVATLVDNFKFPVRQADNITGTYIGTGDLVGVTVDYALIPAAPPSLPLDACVGMPWACVPDDPTTCDPVPAGVAGYFMSGWVND